MKQMAKRMLAFLLAFGLVAMTGPMASLQVSAYAVPAQEIIYLSETEAPAEETLAEETPAEEIPAEAPPHRRDSRRGDCHDARGNSRGGAPFCRRARK